MHLRLEVDDVLAGVMIDVFLAQNKTAEAHAILSEVLQSGSTKADAVNTFLAAMLANQSQEVRDESIQLVESLTRTGQFRPDAITFNTLLTYWLGVYTRLKEISSSPPEKVKEAADRFLATRDALLATPSVALADHVFATMIRFATAQNDVEELDRAVGWMHARRLPYTVKVSNAILDFWSNFPVDKGIDVQSKISSTISQLKRFNLKPNTITYNILMDYYAKRSYPEAVSKLFGEMIEADLRPDGITFSTLLHTMRGQPAHILEMIQHIEESKVVFTEPLYSALLKCSPHVPLRVMNKYVLQMLEERVKPSNIDDLNHVSERLITSYIFVAEHKLSQRLFVNKTSGEVDPVFIKPKYLLPQTIPGQEGVPLEDRIDPNDLKRVHDGQRTNATKDQIREQLLSAQTKAMALYQLLRANSVSMAPDFFRSLLYVFQDDLPTCLAIADDLFAQKKKARVHFVLAELMLHVIASGTVLFHNGSFCKLLEHCIIF